MKKQIIILLSFSILSACTVPHLLVSDSLKTGATKMQVKGTQGFLINQVVTFGEYKTSIIKRNLNTSSRSTYNNDTTFYEPENRLNFTQFTPDNLQAEVNAVVRFLQKEYESFFGIRSDLTNYSYTGEIVLNGLDENTWEFVFPYEMKENPADNLMCVVRDIHVKEILVKALNKTETQVRQVTLPEGGYEFIMDGTPVGAVSVINSGEVWILNEIGPDIKLILSSLSTSLLLEHTLKSVDKTR